MKCFDRIFPLASLAVAAVVATLTTAVVVRATQTITTPNAAFFTYSLAAGASSAPITSVASQAVLVMGTCTTATVRGTGHVSMQRVPATALVWTGLEGFFGTGETSGVSSVPGTHIVWLDNTGSFTSGSKVDIEVHTADSFVVHNAATALRTGNVTLMW